MRIRLILIATAAVGLSAATTAAAEPGFMPDPIYNSPLFNFDGIYVGAQVGGIWMWTPAPGVVAGDIGAMAGANFSFSDALIGGIEFQGNAYIDTTGLRGWDALLLGHFGGYITDSAIAYAAAGAGTSDTSTIYALGAGIEAAVGDQLSARGEVLAVAPWGAMPTGAKATLGLVWHVQ